MASSTSQRATAFARATVSGAAAVICAAALSAAAIPAGADALDPELPEPELPEPELPEPELSEAEYELLRLDMVAVIQHQALALAPEIGEMHLSDAVLSAFATVPRHAFVPDENRLFSYIDMPVPVADGATLSQPFITAYMLHLLEISADDDVLQAAVGAGYEAAILAEVAQSVSAMEFHGPVAELASDNLTALGYASVEVREGDIYYGWPDDRRFDAILVRMAMPYAPTPLLDQLRPGGRLVAPIGPEFGPQNLTLFTKQADGAIRRTRGMAVRFQPLPGGTRL